MAIALVGGATTGTNNTTTVSKPSGVVSGNLLVLMGCSVGTVNLPTAPTGWTQLATRQDNTGGSEQSTVLCYKVAGASEPASYTFTAGSGSTFNSGAIVAFSGQDSTTPIDASEGAGNGTSGSTSVTANALTSSVANDMLVLIYEVFNDVAVSTWPTGVSTYTPASDATSSGYNTGTQTLGAAGSTGSLTTTFGATPGTITGFAYLVKAASGSTAWNQTVTDSHSGLDVLLKRTTHPVQESFSQLDVLAKIPAKTFVDLWSSLDAATATRQAAGTAWTKNVSDAHSALDLLTRSATKLTSDQWSSVDTLARLWVAHLLLTEVFSAVDALTKQATHQTKEGTSAADSTQVLKGALLTVLDAFSAQDTQQRLVQHVLADAHSGQDVLIKQVRHLAADLLSQTDRATAGRALLLTILDAISQRDGVQPTLLTSSGRKTLAMVTSLIASSLGISIVLLSPVLGAQTSVTAPKLAETNTLLPAPLATTLSTTSTLSATASLL